MKKLVFITILLCLSTSLFAGSRAKQFKCDTRYPIVLAHGFAANPGMLGIIDYWYDVEEKLRAEGATVYTTKVNSMDSTVNKAIEFRKQVLQILIISGAEKVNIIGHSHGGIYARYAISNLGLGGDSDLNIKSKVATLTSVDSPHRGSSGPDIVVELCNGPAGEKILGDVLDLIYGNLLGDSNPNSAQNCYDMQTDYMKNIFNKETLDVPEVYYQSWTGRIKYISVSNIWAALLWPAIAMREGANDGAVSVYSAKWGNFRGVLTGAWWSNGVDHIKVIGQPFGITPGFDAPGFYVDVVKDLKKRNY